MDNYECNVTIPCYIKYTDRNKSVGVRKNNISHYILAKKKKSMFSDHMLHYSKPCLCGSLQHSSTKHLDCYLNPRYDDCY